MAVPPVAALLAAASAAVPAQYDLAPGDHLVFRQSLEREVRSPGASATTRFAWTSHVLLLEVRNGRALVGIQRNREPGELVRYSEGGRDRTEAERKDFALELEKRGRAFAEANRFTARGERLLPHSVVREGTSELLPQVHELPPLPPPGAAASWLEPELFGLTLSAASDAGCVRISGAEGRLRLAYSVCGGALESLELSAGYDTPVNRRVEERLRLDRVDRQRGESPAAWLASVDTREAVLQALMVAEQRAPPELLAWRSGEAAFDGRLANAARRFDAPERPADPEDAALAPVVREAFGSGAAPEWNCAVPDRAERGVRLRRADAQVPGTTLRAMRAAPFAGRPYLLHVPESYRGDRPYPLLVLLAGGPGRAVPMAQGLRATLAEAEMLALMPDARGEMWWDDAPTRAVAPLLDEVSSELNVDPRRIFLAGFSNGGTGALLYATLLPDRFAAIAPLMSAGAPFFEGARTLLLANLTRLPTLLVHGDRDGVIPKRASENTVKALRRLAADAPVTLDILKGRGHDLNVGTDDGRTLAFFADKERPAFPRRVLFETRDPARRDWVEIVRKKDGVARVDAEIWKDGLVHVRTERVLALKLLLRRELFAGDGDLVVEIDGRRRYAGPLLEDCGRLLESWRLTRDPYRAWATELAFDVGR
ncbi:MAG TPA: PHB depolymerase family esterase [Vicinamibacteria bacterium]|nr:PHB depolymerase family esterase [Vicinamibacteria bacterium]